MKFNLSTAGVFYTKEQAEKLKELGFTFSSKEHNPTGRLHKEPSDVEIEISTLEELITFSQEWGELIVSDGYIEIYDDYRE